MKLTAAASVLTAALLLAGCGSGPDTTATPTSSSTTTVAPADAMKQWRLGLSPVLDRFSNALSWLGGAAQSLDLSDSRAACREIKSATGDLSRLLPSPDKLVDEHLQGVVDNFGEMTFRCQGLNPGTTKAEFTELTSYRDKAMADMEAAVERIKLIQKGGAS